MSADLGAVPWRRLLHAEALRVTAPRLVRLLVWVLPAAVLILGLSNVFTHDTDTAAAWARAETDYRQALADARQFGLNLSGMGPKNYYDEPRYLLAEAAFVDTRALLSALAVVAVCVGVVAGGSDWTSRVMLTLATVEARRVRLFGTRALVVAGICGGTALALGALLVPLMLLVARLSGSSAGADGHFWLVWLGQYGRGALFVALLGLLGYALGTAVRRTSAAAGIVVFYLVFAEQAAKDYAPDNEWQMRGLAFAILNDKPVIPLEESKCFAGPGCVAVHVDLTPAAGFAGILLHLAPVLAVAAWRSLRRDIG